MLTTAYNNDVKNEISDKEKQENSTNALQEQPVEKEPLNVQIKKLKERQFILNTSEYKDIKNIIFKNSAGKVVYQVAYKAGQAPYYEIDISNIPKGRYTIYIESDGEMVKHKSITIK